MLVLAIDQVFPTVQNCKNHSNCSKLQTPCKKLSSVEKASTKAKICVLSQFFDCPGWGWGQGKYLIPSRGQIQGPSCSVVSGYCVSTILTRQ